MGPTKRSSTIVSPIFGRKCQHGCQLDAKSVFLHVIHRTHELIVNLITNTVSEEIA